MIITIGYYIIPKDIILHKCENTISRDDNETYTKNRFKFLTDYDRTNPLTSKEATLKYLEELEKYEENQEKIDEIKDQKSKLQISSLFASIQNYGKNRSLEQRVNRIYGNDLDVNASKATANVLNKFFNRAKTLKSQSTLPQVAHHTKRRKHQSMLKPARIR